MKENYWRRRDGDQKRGRFIKSDDTLMKSVSLTDFSFMEICDTPYAETDNSYRSVIRPDLHEPGSLEDVIREHEGLVSDIRPQEMKRPVLRPLDFTQDWERQRARANARRQMHIDDEDELELELEYNKKKDNAAPGKSGAAKDSAAAEAAPTDGATAETAATESGASTEQPTAVSPPVQEAGTGESAEKPKGTERFREQTSSMDEIGRQINEINLKDDEPDEEGNTQTPPNEETIETPQGNLNPKFIETTPANQQSFSEQEESAMQSYKQATNVQEQYEARMTDAVEGAKKRGYQEGYQYGEEKAALALRSQVADLSGNLSEIIQQLGSLKKQVLKSAEQNFQELAQAISIALIGKELETNPDSLNAVIQKIIDETIKDDEFEIAVHSETKAALDKIGDKSLTSHLRSDDKIKPGEFRIDGNLSVLDGTVTELVRNLLAQLDTQLFKTTPKAG